MKLFRSCFGMTLVLLNVATYAVSAPLNPSEKAWILLPIWFLAGFPIMLLFIKYMTEKAYGAVFSRAVVIYAFSFGITYFIGHFFWFALFKKFLIGIQSESFTGITTKFLELLVFTGLSFIIPFLGSIITQTIIAHFLFSGLRARKLFWWIGWANVTLFSLWILLTGSYFAIAGVPVRYLFGY